MPLNRPFVITREMEQARARLEAYKNKIQPYPALPKEEAPITSYQDEGVGYRQLSNRFDRWMGMVTHLENRLNEHIDRGKGKRGKDYL